MSKRWTADQIMELCRAYQPACVLAAAADLDLFRVVADHPRTADEVAAELPADARGTTILLDALVALRLLTKRGDHYRTPAGVARLLAGNAPGSMLAMAQHQANCLRRWTQLAAVVKTGQLAPRYPSIRGEAADQAAFIGAMDNLSAPMAAALVQDLGPPAFAHLLDLGGASGTWTLAFLQTRPSATATIFDLPHVIPLAEQRLAAAGMQTRVRLVAGDFDTDLLPAGADLAWVSAIVHQNSRAQNRRLFAAVLAALVAGGRILIRDILMEPTRTAPVAGALFAVNMLVGTAGGGTFTFDELRADLEAAGFVEAVVLRRDDWMNSIVRARKPA